jgi:hypothetical protein
MLACEALLFATVIQVGIAKFTNIKTTISNSQTTVGISQNQKSGDNVIIQNTEYLEHLLQQF